MGPLILACDTTQGACSAALYRAGDGVLAADLSTMSKGHAEALMPMLADLLATAGVRPGDIDRLAVTHGPGTFTGVRVGLAAMRGLALALQLPLKTYGTLEVMAAAGQHDGPVIVAVDARRQVFYAQGFDADKRPRGAPAALTAAAVLQLVPSRENERATPIGLIGSGTELLLADPPTSSTSSTSSASSASSTSSAPSGAGFIALDAPPYPDARLLARMAAGDDDWHDLPPAEPLYLRPPDATLPDRDKFPARM